jgi:hypothetical protein
MNDLLVLKILEMFTRSFTFVQYKGISFRATYWGGSIPSDLSPSSFIGTYIHHYHNTIPIITIEQRAQSTGAPRTQPALRAFIGMVDSSHSASQQQRSFQTSTQPPPSTISFPIHCPNSDRPHHGRRRTNPSRRTRR